MPQTKVGERNAASETILNTKRALESVYYFDETGGKSLSHSEVKNELGWSVLDWAQTLGGFDV